MKGDHYSSIMFRVKVQYKTDAKETRVITKSLIVKTLPDEGDKYDVLSQSLLFETEISMYTQTLPKISKILADHGNPITLAPKILFSSLEPRKVIILEDLKEQGYEMMRNRHPTESEMKAIYRKLAKLHAASYVLGQSEDSEYITQHQNGMCGSELVLEHGIFKNGIGQFIEFLETQQEFQEYARKFQAMKYDILKKSHELFSVYKNGKQNEILVLNHGDFHLRNLMFKFDENSQMQDFILFDFQLCVYAPPVIDLMYSEYIMCSSESRDKYDNFLRAYFEQFNETLRKINYKDKQLTYYGLKMSSLQYRHFLILIISFFVPLLYANETTSCYQNPLFNAELRKLLPKLLLNGYMD
ncbi:unnamed protein product [Ceratitis capitata]|nr:unnamed protein product [Ceratitis capitata]